MSDRKSTDKFKNTFLESAHQAGSRAKNENLQTQKEFFEKIGSNRVLKNGKINFSYNLPWGILAKKRDVENWWSLADEIRIFFEKEVKKI